MYRNNFNNTKKQEVKHMKKIISIILSVLMIFSCFSIVPVTVTVTATSTTSDLVYISGDFAYTLSDTLEATITDHSGRYETVVIPETIDGYTVTEIGANAFYGCTNLKELELAKTITKIGQTAFAECTSLTKVFIPKSLKKVGIKCIVDNPDWRYAPYSGYYGPFYNCTSLTEVVFEEGIETIPSHLFGNSNVGITEIHIPNTVKTIETCAFTACEKLKTLTLSNNLKTIKCHAFTACSSLEGVQIPKTLTTAERDDAYGGRIGPFYLCSSLKEVSFEEGMTVMPSYIFSGSRGVTSIKIPYSIKAISYSAFEGCTGLTMLELPPHISSIGHNAFRDCINLKSINLSRVSSIGMYSFQNCTSLNEITALRSAINGFDTYAFNFASGDNLTIYAFSGGQLESYCKKYNFNFVDIEVTSDGLCLDQSICESTDYVVMNKGETKEIKYEISPLNSTDLVELKSSKNIVSIDGMYITAKEAGDTVITATSSSGLTFSFNLHINGEKTVKDITITKLPDKLVYKKFEPFDRTGLEVMLHFTDDTSEITTDYIVGGYNTGILGNQTITVRYDSSDGTIFRKTFQINIYDPRGDMTGISVKQLPNKTNYFKYESLDTTGLIVIAHYESGATAEIKDYTVSGYNSLKLGEQTITVKKDNFTTTFKITLTEKTILIGDVNSDSVVNILDATDIQKYIANFIELTDEQKNIGRCR